MSESGLDVETEERVDPEEIVAEIESNDYVYSVLDASAPNGSAYHVYFNTRTLPRAFLWSDCLQVTDVWLYSLPSWWMRYLFEDFAFKNGLGNPCIGAEVVVRE